MDRPSLACAAAISTGLAVSSAHPLGMLAAIAMPAVVMCQLKCRVAYFTAVCYYAGALWPLIPGARNFFGASVPLVSALALWAVASTLLASPWPLVWSASREQAWWRAPLGLALSVVPPLGIIGWASPLIAAGFLFPGTGWWGLAACVLAPGLLAAWPRYALLGTAAGAILCNTVCAPVPPPPTGWVAIDTHLGAIAHGSTSPLAEYEVVRFIQHAALAANAKVILLPETVVPAWTAATDAFWHPTLDHLRVSGKTLILGARVPMSLGNTSSISRISNEDFSAAIATLRGGPTVGTNSARPETPFAYANGIVIRGADTAIFHQRIPVPIAMWKPFQPVGASLDSFGPGTVRIRNQRVAVLICYEQLLVWPVLTSLCDRPDVLLAVANDYWANGTPIRQYQRLAIRGWSRLFRLPYLSATNT